MPAKGTEPLELTLFFFGSLSRHEKLCTSLGKTFAFYPCDVNNYSNDAKYKNFSYFKAIQ